MPPICSNPFHQMANHALLFNLQRTNTNKKSTKSSSAGGGGGGLFRMFKLLPMLTTGCKMVALLGNRHRKPFLTDKATTGTLFGYRKGRLNLAIQEDPHKMPIFVIELPLSTSAFHKEMASDILRITLESDTKTHKKKLMEEFVWAVYCNGRKGGYSIRRKNMGDEEVHVMKLLKGVSMGAGVLPGLYPDKENGDGQLSYIRARFDKVVGSKDSESFYMINPDGGTTQELSIFFVRSHKSL
ncbi:protein MIZU-KUSSEI 1-like [Primulina eburnea]|uniref:protein MIZU-KUSSEI 1-like n=1 Tax=Primulina eburnea TaxID=1245227 RepID=UPI003C6C61C1